MSNKTRGCPHCGGFGYTDDEGDDECPMCNGDGTVSEEQYKEWQEGEER